MPEDFMQQPGWAISGGVTIPLTSNKEQFRKGFSIKTMGGYNSGYGNQNQKSREEHPVTGGFQGGVEFNPFLKNVTANAGFNVSKQTDKGQVTISPSFGYALRGKESQFNTAIPISYSNRNFQFNFVPSTRLNFVNGKVFNPVMSINYDYINNPQLMYNSGYGQR